MVRVGVGAIDGAKVHADPSNDATRAYEEIAREILVEADEEFPRLGSERARHAIDEAVWLWPGAMWTSRRWWAPKGTGGWGARDASGAPHGGRRRVRRASGGGRGLVSGALRRLALPGSMLGKRAPRPSEPGGAGLVVQAPDHLHGSVAEQDAQREPQRAGVGLVR